MLADPAGEGCADAGTDATADDAMDDGSASASACDASSDGAEASYESSCVSVTTYGTVGDGVTDDSAAFQTAANALAGTGVAECIPAGQYMIHSTIVLPSNLTIIGSPGAVLIGDLTSGGGQTKATFLTQWKANGVNSTLAAANVPGANTVSSAASFAAGQQVSIQSQTHTFQLAFYTVQNVSGTGPYTLTLDRPVLLQFANGDKVSGLGTSIPTNIHLLCNGMKFTGNPVRHAEFAGTIGSSIEGCTADTSLGASNDYWFSFDVGGLRNTFKDMQIDCGHTPTSYGLALETQEGSKIVNSTVTNANVGYLLLDSVQSEVIGSQATGGNYGVVLSGEDSLVGCSASRAVGGHYDGNSAYGVMFGSGSRLCSAESLSADQNSVGVFFGGGGTSPTGNRLVNVEANANKTYGAWIVSGAAGAVVNGLSASNNGFAGIAIQDDVLVTDIGANNSFAPPGASLTSQITLYQTRGTAIVSGVNVVDNQATSNSNIDSWGGTMNLSNAYVQIGPGNYGILNHAGTIRLTHSVFAPVGSQAGERGVYAAAVGATVQLGESVDLTGCAVPAGGPGATTMTQGSGVFASVAASGTEALSQVQAEAQAIQTTRRLTGDVVETVPAGISGLQYLVYNNAILNGHTWSVGVAGGATVTLAAGEHTLLQSDGVNMRRVVSGL